MITAEEAKHRTEIAKKNGTRKDMEKIQEHFKIVEEYISCECDKGRNSIIVSLPDCYFLSTFECQQIVIDYFTKKHFTIKFPRTFKYIISW